MYQELYKQKKYEECLATLKTLDNSNNICIYKFLCLYFLGKYKEAYEINIDFSTLNYDQKEFINDKINNIKIKLTENLKPDIKNVFCYNDIEVLLPRNFSFIVAGKIAGMSMPKHHLQIKAFEYMKAYDVINMMDENEVNQIIYNNTKVKHHIFPTPNGKSPTLDQINKIMIIIENAISQNNSVIVHCGGGKGRAGTVLACFMAKHGLDGSLNRNMDNVPYYSTDQVINKLRELRPGSIESISQENFVGEYINHLWKLYNTEKTHKYPSIPYLPYSPTISDNPLINDLDYSNELTIMEKMDGENCCLYNGKVYARTHSHEAEHESFDMIKAEYINKIMPLMQIYKIPLKYMLFGENMCGIHSIEYDNLVDCFYLFGIFDKDKHIWLSVNDTVYIADKLALPVAKILSIAKYNKNTLKLFLDTQIKNKSSCSSEYHPEGFVIRYSGQILKSDFELSIVKYVMRDFKQTNDNWKNTWKKASINNMQITKNNIKLPYKLIILCGLPGSGKSTFAKTLESSDCIIVNQDKLGSKSACDSMVCDNIKSNKIIVIDRCNITLKDRYYWYEMCFKPKTLTIYFDIPKDICEYRVKNRQNHETIKIGSGKDAINTFYKQLEIPDKNHFGEIIIIKNTDDIINLLKKFGVNNLQLDDQLIKFPRTHHLFDPREFNKGCPCVVSRDDLLMNPKEREAFLNTHIVIQEKIDGANLGFSMDSNKKILAQNRSHYVNSSTHEQFKKLDKWISDHYNDLSNVLEDGKYILYGEWCYARHGIYYDDLPDYFIAFDIYDRYNGKFLSTTKFYIQLSKGPSLHYVPIITSGVFTRLEDVNKLLKHKSEFTDGNIEGIYIRKEDDNYLIDRCKVIAPSFMDFFDVQWTKKKFLENKKRYS